MARWGASARRLAGGGGGYCPRMPMNPQDTQNFRQNWSAMRSQVQSQFPGLTEDDLNQGASDPDQLAERIAAQTGQSVDAVCQQLAQMAMTQSGQTQSGGQSQNA